MLQQREMLNKQRRMKKWIPTPEVSHLAETSRLGRFTVCYRFTDYPTSGCSSTLVFFPLSLLFFSAGIFLLWYVIETGIVLLSVCLVLFGVIPLFGLAYVSGKRALKASSGDSASAYFYQQGFVFVQGEQRITLRWEQIERAERVDGGPVYLCRVALADGGDILLMNGGRRGLYEEIRRRVMHSRKGHQHHEKRIR